MIRTNELDAQVNLVLKGKSRRNNVPPYLVERLDMKGNFIGYDFNYIKYSEFLSKKLHIHNIEKNLFIFDELKHVYRTNVNQIETTIRDTFKEYDVLGKLSGIERETLCHMESMGCVDKYPFLGKFGTLHVKNGSFDLETGEINHDVKPEMMYDYRIETEYEKFEETKELYDFLDLYGTREPIDTLAKIIWQRAFHDTLKELTIYIGPKDSGKTTCAELIQATLDGDILTRYNTTRTLLHQLLERFGYADLEGKLLNYGDDLPDMFVKNSNRINEMLGSIVRHIERKGKDGYDSTVTVYFLFSANNLPPLDDDDSVIWGKIHLVEFNNVIKIPKIPRTLLFTKELKKQLLFRAVEKALEYNKKPYENSQSAEEVREKWHESSTDVDAFLLEAIEYDYNGNATLDDIKKHYEKWIVHYHKKRHIKYLNKKLQSYFRKTSKGNVYTLKTIPFIKETEQQTLNQASDTGYNPETFV